MKKKFIVITNIVLLSLYNVTLGSEITGTLNLGGLNGNSGLGGVVISSEYNIKQPANIAALAMSKDSIKLTWDLMSGATEYKIYRSTAAAFDANVSTVYEGTGSSYTDTGLTASTKYYYKVNSKYIINGSTIESTYSGEPVFAETLADSNTGNSNTDNGGSSSGGNGGGGSTEGSTSGGGGGTSGGGGGSVSSMLSSLASQLESPGLFLTDSQNIPTNQELNSLLDKFNTTLSESNMTYINLSETINGKQITILKPKFESDTIQSLIDKISLAVIKEIKVRKISGSDLDNLVNNYNKLLASIKIVKDNSNSEYSSLPTYFLKGVNDILSQYPAIKEFNGLKDDEFSYALSFMKRHGLTSYDDVSKYRPFDTLTRQEAAKFYVEFAMKLNSSTTGNISVTDNTVCNFNDVSTVDSTLKDYIIKACQLGFMKGSNNSFRPFDGITKGEAVAVLMRTLNGGALDESSTPWYKNYLTKASTMGVTKDTKMSNFDKPLSRYEVGLLLFRSYQNSQSKVAINK